MKWFKTFVFCCIFVTRPTTSSSRILKTIYWLKSITSDVISNIRRNKLKILLEGEYIKSGKTNVTQRAFFITGVTSGIGKEILNCLRAHSRFLVLQVVEKANKCNAYIVYAKNIYNSVARTRWTYYEIKCLEKAIHITNIMRERT